jgi:uncharacterized protein with HEPN domain
MRNHLVHGYFAIDTDLLWIAARSELVFDQTAHSSNGTCLVNSPR